MNKRSITGGIIILIVVLIIGGFFLAKSKNHIANQSPINPMISNNSEKTQSATTEQNQVAPNLTLTLSSPTNNSTVNTANINVVGKTLPLADLYVNEKDAKADNKGNFSVAYTLEEGENYLTVGANDENGNSQEMELTIYYQP